MVSSFAIPTTASCFTPRRRPRSPSSRQSCAAYVIALSCGSGVRAARRATALARTSPPAAGRARSVPREIREARSREASRAITSVELLARLAAVVMASDPFAAPRQSTAPDAGGRAAFRRAVISRHRSVVCRPPGRGELPESVHSEAVVVWAANRLRLPSRLRAPPRHEIRPTRSICRGRDIASVPSGGVHPRLRAICHTRGTPPPGGCEAPRALGDAGDNGIEVTEDLRLRHAHHMPTELVERSVPRAIMTRALVVVLPVDLDDEPHLRACEVDDVLPDDELTPKPKPALRPREPPRSAFPAFPVSAQFV